MDEQSVRYFCRELGIALDARPSSSGWLSAACPFAPHTHKGKTDNSHSFGVTVNEAKKSFYKCLACHEKGTITTLIFRLGRWRKRDYAKLAIKAEETEAFKPVLLLPEWRDDESTYRKTAQESKPYPDRGIVSKYLSAVTHPYLRERGIFWKTAARLNLRVDEYQQRILFPVVDKKGYFRGLSGRYFGDKPTSRTIPKVRDYAGLPKRDLLLGEYEARRSERRIRGGQERSFPARGHSDGIRGDARLIVVEGLFDYARLAQAGFYGHTVALLGSELTKSKERTLIELDMSIVWMVDNDDAGQAFLYGRISSATGERDFSTGALSMFSGKLPQYTVEYPEGKKDPGECTDDEIRDMVTNAKMFV